MLQRIWIRNNKIHNQHINARTWPQAQYPDHCFSWYHASNSQLHLPSLAGRAWARLPSGCRYHLCSSLHLPLSRALLQLCACIYWVLLEVGFEREGAVSLSKVAFILSVYEMVGDSGVLRWSAGDCSWGHCWSIMVVCLADQLDRTNWSTHIVSTAATATSPEQVPCFSSYLHTQLSTTSIGEEQDVDVGLWPPPQVWGQPEEQEGGGVTKLTELLDWNCSLILNVEFFPKLERYTT